MSLKDLFSNLNASIVTSGSLDRIGEEVESTDYLQSYLKQQNKLRSHIDFSKPENFARFGSAEKYYLDSIQRVYNTYPYDGSLYEKIQFELSSSDIDRFIFENDYPRTNGYVNFSGDGWTGQLSSNEGYGVPETQQYIFIKGGPNTSSRLKGKGIDDTSGNYRSGFANIYDVAKDRDSNLRIDGVDGNTVEFFLKKEQFNTSLTEKEVLFDAFTTLFEAGDEGYGRLRITLTGSDGVPFLVTYQSGSSGFEDQLLGQNITTSSVADNKWHHYAITFKNNGSQVETQLYIDGACNHTTNLGTSINYVSGNFNATIGALGSATGSSGPVLGAGKFSGSLDEFRFWKAKRTSPQVNRYMREQVGGGTNTDDANVTLGVYYKFNEGITQTASIDKTILDYSGRISNGTFVGYNTSVRNIGSAFVSSSLAEFEFKDPILYSFHPAVAALENNKTSIGREYDYTNANSIYNSIPAWITETDNTKDEPPLKNLTQIISNYFDTLYTQIEDLSKLRHVDYVSGTADRDDKPYFFNDRILQGAGLPYVPDLFGEATFFEYFKNRSNEKLFKEKLYDVKNTIYKNLYNNLAYINKTKGTEKAFRNALRCFGVDDEIYKIRYYATDAVHEYRDNYKSVVENKNYINFALTGTSESTVYQYQTDSNTTSFISSSNAFESTGFGFTVEAQAIFPIEETSVDIGTTITSADRATVSSVRDFVEDKETSIYGVRTADASLGENNLTVPANDRAGFVVKTVRDESTQGRAFFKLQPTDATSFIPTITSSYFDDVYDNTKWNFAVTVKPTRYGQYDYVSGSSDDTTYDVVFQGVNTELDEVRNSFELTTTISKANGQTVMTEPKRVFVGALRENLSGSLTTRANSFVTDCRFWLAPLSFVDIKKHNIDFENHGIENPYRSAYLFQTDGREIRVPNIETLALSWNFSNLTSSNASGQFSVVDFSSGSATDNRFGALSSVLSRQHSGRGDYFLVNNTRCFTKKDVFNAKTQLPEYVNSSDMIRISNQDDVTFTRSTRPTEFVLSIEKSMYQTVSEEMIKIFSTIADYGSLAGNVVNRYRFENKDLTKLRQMFFENVSNTPKLEKYVEYYKWLDTSLNVILANLVPATAITFDSESLVQTMVEEYVFNRDRYTSKFPTLEFKQSDPEGSLRGVNELLYNWELGHSPLNEQQDDNCLWWKDRSARDGLPSSGNSAVDADRDTILTVLNNQNNASPPNLSGSNGSYEGSTYAIRKFARPYNLTAENQKDLHGGSNTSENKRVGFWDAIRSRPTPSGKSEGALITINPSQSTLEDFKDCDDNSTLRLGKRKYSFSVQTSIDGDAVSSTVNKFKGGLVFPFSLYSSSVNNGAMGDVLDFQSNLNVTNLHQDSYGSSNEVPMQGPFTEKFVGGRAYRHIFSNFTPNQAFPDAADSRIEGWKISASSDSLDLVNINPTNLKSVYFREELAKRPVNIRNIKMFTGSSEAEPIFEPNRPGQALGGATNIGNYTKGYELVMTNGRSINNRYLAESDGDLPTITTQSTIVSGGVEFALPRRDLTGSNSFIIVNRFSSPGDPATMGEGMLDVAAAEYSVYNALPWRNLSVRIPLDQLYSDHTNQFGYFSDAFTVAAYDIANQPYPGGSSSVNALNYDGTGSFHKVNRNGRLSIAFSGATGYTDENYVTGTKYDNWFVQHQIPQTDIQYAWITASIINDYSGAAAYWFEQPDWKNAGFASTDLTFVSASDSGSGDVKVDFAGMNILILDNVHPSLNLLSSSDYFNTNIVSSLATVLETNALTLHRQGPAGGANWKFYKKDNHPIVRVHREENRLSFRNVTQFYDSDQGLAKHSVGIASVIEPPINSKFSPIDFDLSIKVNIDGGTKDAKFKQSYLNHFVKFSEKIETNFDLNNGGFFTDIEGYGPKKLAYDPLTTLITQDRVSPQTNPINAINSIETDEVIYPREMFTYLSSHRQRENYVNGYWRDSRQARFDNSKINPFINPELSPSPPVFLCDLGFNVTTSIWPLDARLDFTTASPGRIKSGTFDGGCSTSVDWIVIVSGTTDAAGILQNAAAPYSSFVEISSSTTNGPQISYSTLLPQYNRRIAGVISTDVLYEYKFGDTKWEAGDQSGINPFFDTYSDYVEDIKRMGKDFSIIPEFRISEHMDYYLNTKSGDFLADNPTAFSITGAIPQNSGEDSFVTTYSHTDFLRAFNLINDDYENKVTPQTINLECEGLIKLLPYDGFYPADRTVQIAKLFWESYSASFAITGNITNFVVNDNLLPSSAGNIRPIWNTLFAPGILYNSIKSGIAVDYPAHTDDAAPLLISGSPNQRNGLGFLEDIPRIATPFNHRVPFETLVNPEGTLSGITLIDNEPHPSASVNLTASLTGLDKINYKLAMHNFLASTIDFFKPNGEMLTLAGVADNDPNFGTNLEEGKEYKMRIVCSHAKFRNINTILNYYSALQPENLVKPGFDFNTQTMVMYSQTGSDPLQRSDYYGCAFGPPCNNETVGAGYTGSVLAGLTLPYPLYGSASYEPFTPSYYDGYSHIEITYKHDIPGLSLPEMVSQFSSSFERFGGFGRVPAVSDQTNTPSGRNEMQLSSSLNYLQLVSKVSPVLDEAGNVIQFNNDANSLGTRLVIQPKWETPVLNFKDVAVTLPDIGSGSVARGMWHQYGSLPLEEEGIFLQVQELAPGEKTNPDMTGSLREALGLPGGEFKIGQIAEQRTISEAIIAVPHVLSNPANEGDSNKTRFDISRSVISMAQRFLKDGRTEKYNQLVEKFPEREPSKEIIDMVAKMKKYVIPPKFDFLTNPTIKPFAMFIFEFSVDLTQEDLANIWQNLLPDVGVKARKVKASLPVNIFDPLTSDIFQGKALLNGIPSDIQWEVFKVKQKGSWNYFDKTAQIEKEPDDNVNLTGISKGTIPKYSYNWPYDFCSLVELGKINARTTFGDPRNIEYISKSVPNVKPAQSQLAFHAETLKQKQGALPQTAQPGSPQGPTVVTPTPRRRPSRPARQPARRGTADRSRTGTATSTRTPDSTTRGTTTRTQTRTTQTTNNRTNNNRTTNNRTNNNRTTNNRGSDR